MPTFKFPRRSVQQFLQPNKRSLKAKLPHLLCPEEYIDMSNAIYLHLVTVPDSKKPFGYQEVGELPFRGRSH